MLGYAVTILVKLLTCIYPNRYRVMHNNQLTETFTIDFVGSAFDNHEIHAGALGYSLVAVDEMMQLIAEELYGSNYAVDTKVTANFKPGSFVVNLIIEKLQSNPIEITAAIATISNVIVPSTVWIFQNTIKLARWAFGKKIKILKETDNRCLIQNEEGQESYFPRASAHVYKKIRCRSLLSMGTQTLDLKGAEEIRITETSSFANVTYTEVITLKDREIFKLESGVVTNDITDTLELIPIQTRMDGSSKGWVFSLGEDQFKADILDEDFLNKVASGKYIITNTTVIRAIVRIVQYTGLHRETRKYILKVEQVVNT